MPTLRASLVLLALSSGVAEAQSPTDASLAAALEGAWTRVESIAPNGAVTASPPGLRTFVAGHYSWMQAPADRTTVDSTATAAQLRAAWGPVTANSGRFAVVGQTMTQRPMVDKVAQGMADGAFQTFAIRLAADSMWITQIVNDQGLVRNTGTGKYVRVR